MCTLTTAHPWRQRGSWKPRWWRPRGPSDYTFRVNTILSCLNVPHKWYWNTTVSASLSTRHYNARQFLNCPFGDIQKIIRRICLLCRQISWILSFPVLLCCWSPLAAGTTHRSALSSNPLKKPRHARTITNRCCRHYATRTCVTSAALCKSLGLPVIFWLLFF